MPQQWWFVWLRSAWFARVRVLSAIVLLMGTALFSSYELLNNSPPLSKGTGADEVTAYEVRMAPLKQFLPKHGVVCYVPDYASSETAKKDFFLARYALAPLVIRNVPDCDPLIGDFPSGIPTPVGTGSYAVLKDFGHGILLLKRNGR